jgi:hypothetical protein
MLDIADLRVRAVLRELADLIGLQGLIIRRYLALSTALMGLSDLAGLREIAETSGQSGLADRACRAKYETSTAHTPDISL